MNSIAIVLLKQGKSSEALAYADERMKIARNLGYPEDIESVASTFKKIYQISNEEDFCLCLL